MDVVEKLRELADEIERDRAPVKDVKPAAISANGAHLKEGITVWVTMEHAKDCGKGYEALGGKAGLHGCRYGEPRRINFFKSDGNVRIDLDKPDGAWCPASWLTTEEPDTQERIDRDGMVDYAEYWRCEDDICFGCPAKVDGKSPRTRYRVNSCAVAQGLDIARRQAALDAALKEAE